MAVYLKEFENHTQYNNYINSSGVMLPNVSICTTERDVHYNPMPDPYVEIGGIKWATMNVGANSITDTGLYFQWGDISGYTAAQCGSGSGQKYFNWSDYKYCSGAGTSSSAMTKYNYNDRKKVLDANDDAATVNMGSGWRMPTKEEYGVLKNAVNTVWTTNYQGSGVNGLLCTDKTDISKALFFPACGYCSNGVVGNVGGYGYYWSSSLHSSFETVSYDLYFIGGGVYWGVGDGRYTGLNVRAVVNE